jgi:chromosome segregation ATPase
MDIVALLETGGPLAGLAAIAGFSLKAYLEKRRSDREDWKAERESESGIVETTKESLRIVRDQIAQMYAETQELRSQIAELEARFRAKDEGTLLRPKGRVSMPSQRSSPPDVPHSMPN